MHDFFFSAQHAAEAQGIEHVVHVGEREARVRGLLALAVRVEFFGGGGELGGEGGVVGEVGEGVWVKAPRLVVARVIADSEPATCGQRPNAVNLATSPA